jgi:hypothetical protein
MIGVEPPVGSIISVWRLGYKHVGLYVGRWNSLDHLVVDNSPERKGVAFRPLSAFEGRQRIKIVREARPEDADWLLRRAQRHVGRRYHLLTYNCEHFVRDVWGHRMVSPQLRMFGTAALSVGVGAGVWAAGRLWGDR